jgi:O-antigen ligase
MMGSAGDSTAQRAEHLFLYAFILALPVAEAPKSLFLALYALQWLYNHIRRHDFGGPLRLWDVALLAMAAAAFLSVACAGLPGARWKDGLDTLMYTLLGLLVSRADYAPQQQLRLYVTLLVSTVLALIYAYWELHVTQVREQLEFHSVGFFLHTAIYLTIVTLALLGLLLHYRPLTLLQRLALGALLVWFLWSLFHLESRLTAALAILGLSTLVLAYPAPQPRHRTLLLGAMGLLLAGSLLVGNPALEKFVWVYQQSGRAFLNGREAIWPGALTAFLRYPLCGVGVDNFGALTEARVLEWAGQGYRLFDYSVYRHFGHAHSLYLNTLAERGLAGFLALLAFLFAAARLLWRRRPSADTDPLDATLWSGALGAWLVTTLGGLFNTTLHHEHALLTLLLIGLLVGADRVRRRHEDPADQVPQHRRCPAVHTTAGQPEPPFPRCRHRLRGQ